MNSFLVCWIVTAAFFAVSVVLGFRLKRCPKPYPKILLASHIVLLFLIGLGIGQCLDKIKGVTTGTSLATVALYVAGATINVSLVSGIVMLFSKQKKRGWILTHLMAALLMGLAILVAGVFRALNW